MKCFFYIACFLLLTACGTKKQTPEIVPPTSELQNAYIEKFHEALRLKELGQYNPAIEAFETCLSIKPNDDAVHYALAQLYLLTQQLSKSSASIQTAVKLDPKNKWYIQEYAYMLFETKNYKEAAKNFKTLAEMEPQNIDWLLSYAEALMRSNDFSGAIKALDKLENEIGVNPELSIQKFSLYRKIGQDEKALKELDKAMKEYPSDVQLLANYVDYYFEKKQDEKAFSYLIQLANNDPNNGNAHMALAQYYDQKGNKNESYAELIKAFRCDDVKLDTKIKVVLSMFESQYKLDPQMMELASILVDKYPNEGRVYTVRGDFHLKNLEDTLALKDFQTALQFEKTKYAIWEQVLIMEYQFQQYARLYEDAKTCLEYFPMQTKVYLLCGIGANQVKKYEDAIEKLTLGEDLVVNDPFLTAEILAQKGDAYFALKKLNEGKAAYDKALTLDSKNVLYKNNYAYRLALANIDLAKAHSLILEVMEASPGQSHFIDTYGWVLFQQGKYAEALEQFKKALALQPNDKHIIEHVGDALFKTGNVADAILSWKKAKEMGSSNVRLNDKIEKKAYYDPIY